VDLDVISEIFIKYSALFRCWRRKCEYNGIIHKLFIYFEKAYDLVRTEILYNFVIEFGIPKKVITLIKMCLYETCSKVHVDKDTSGALPIQTGQKQGDTLLSLFYSVGL
jgi:hypothetical protein